MIVAHIMGLPIEESVIQLAPFGAAMTSVVVIAGRTRIDRLRRWLGHRFMHKQRQRSQQGGTERGAPGRSTH
jgi:hypothetical protein